MTAPHLRLRLAALLLAVATAGGCAAPSEDAKAERARLVDTTASELAAELGGALARARRALDLLARADAERAPSDGAAITGGREADQRRILDVLERVRAEAGVDGILADAPSGDRLWAGAPVEPKDLPAAKPWDESFATGDVVFHAGPFLRALVVAGPGPRGGTARVTVVLADKNASPLDGTVERRWALAHRVQAVRILPPASLKAPTQPGTVRVGVPRDAPVPSLALEVTAPDEDVVRGYLEESRLRRDGAAWLVGGLVTLALAFVLVRRFVTSAAARAAAGLVGVALARHGLRLLDVPSRFPDVSGAFETTDFGFTGFLGWLSTPGDLALTGAALLVAALLVASLVARAAGARSRAVRTGSGLLAIVVAAISVSGWLHLVDDASTESRIDIFGAGRLLPSVPRALLLLGLCAATAAAFVLCRAALRRVEAAAPSLPRAMPRLLGAAAVASLAWALPGDPFAAWSCFLMPGAAAVVGRLRGGDARPGAPSRILLTSVLAAVLLVPMLFQGAMAKGRGDVRAQVADWVRREAVLESRLDSSLSGLAADPHLARELSNSRRDPDELAFYVWLALGFSAPDADGALVLVRNSVGRRVSRFALNTPPPRRFPRIDTPPEDATSDVTVERRTGSGEALGCVIGHLRVRGSDDRVVGTISVAIADPLAVELAGAAPRIPVLATPRGGPNRDRTTRPLSLRLVADGRVVATNDVRASSSPPKGLPPAEELSQPRWLEPEHPGDRPALAVDAGARGILVAEPTQNESDELLFGVARIVIVAVGAGVLAAVLALAVGLRRFRPRLQDRILVSYFIISVVPLVFLGYANWKDAVQRSDEEFRRRQEVLVRAARDEFQLAGISATAGGAESYTAIQAEDIALYRGGEVEFSSFTGLFDAELVRDRLPATAYRATELDRREFHVEDSIVAGTQVRTAYAPMRGPDGEPFGTVAVPLRYDPARAERQASETGSVLLAAYLLTLVLVVVIGIYTARGLARPLGELVTGTRRVAAGELSTAIPGEGGDEIGQLVAAFNSMTRDLAATRDVAARAEREAAWRGMARQIAHEIKNPLTPMKLLLQQLVATSKSDPKFASEMIDPTAKVVLEQIDALTRIANDFSAFARFPPRALEACDVNAVLGSVIALYGPGEAARTEVRGELEAGLPAVRWDEDELRRVFVNLVANAVQALDEAKGHVRIVVRTTRSRVPGTGRSAVLVTVTDDGVGILPENQPRLFEPDFSTKTHGTGLGLAICRRIVTDLSGEIRIESAPGVGTTVSTWLPCEEAAGRGT